MKSKGITPNFYCSIPYWQVSGTELKQDDGYYWLECDGVCLIPPISLYEDQPIPVNFIWSDFQNYNMGEPWYKTFLDWEYIFNPKDFSDLSGKKWRKFRKNIKKWPTNNENWQYTLESPKSEELYDLLLEWLQNKSETAQDSDIIGGLVTDEEVSIQRKYLFNNNELIGVNVWDENYHYINFRVSITHEEEPFSDEFLRWLFYTDPTILKSNKLVNDGGVVDNPNLEWFKDKMNPYIKRPVYSWERAF